MIVDVNNKCTVSSLAQYIAAIEKYDLYNCISRGESQLYKNPMRSSILRRDISNYSQLLEDYHFEVETMINQSQEHHFLAFAQHHGIPTNLLDFSYSPLVSLYFCIDGCKDKGYVYFIKKSKLISLNKIVLGKPFAWGMLEDLLINDTELYEKIAGAMEQVFLSNREEMVSYFEEHAEDFISNFEKTCDLGLYRITGGGVEEFKSTLAKYKKDKIKWNADSATVKKEGRATLQIYRSYSEFIHAMAKIYKGNIFYPEDFLKNYAKRQRIYPNADIMLFLFKMESILCCRRINAKEFELEFPFYFTYHPPIIDDRVRNQASIFIFQLFQDCLIKSDEFGCIPIWQKIVPDFVMEIQNPERIKKELDAIGYNSKHIYCDYDTVAKYVANQYA